MNAERREQALRVLLLAGLIAAAPGCFLFDAARRIDDDGKSAEPPKMSTIEARAALSRARQHLYGQAQPDHAKAIELAETVLSGCDSVFYVWEAHAVKVAALQGQGKHTEAAAAARAGVDALFAAQPGPFSEGALTALKRLAVAYVENAAAARDGELVPTLCSWRETLSGRYNAAEPEGLAGLRQIDETFNTLRELADESMASRPVESRIRRVVQWYLAAFNRGEFDGVARVVQSDSSLATELRRRFAAAETPEAVRGLYLLGPVQVAVRDDGASATASCDLLVTTAAGRARTAPNVCFVLSQQPSGAWIILDVVGHP